MENLSKLCIITSGPVYVDDCEIFIIDVESGLKDSGRALNLIASTDDNEYSDEEDYAYVDVDSNKQGVDGVLKPALRQDVGLVGVRGFAVLSSTVYMFQDGLMGPATEQAVKGDGFESLFPIDPNAKLGFAYDLPLSRTTGSDVVKLDGTMTRKIRDMHGAKADPRATPTPDGKKIVVFSSLYDYDVDSPEKRIDFVIYDPKGDRWQTLPGFSEAYAQVYDCRHVSLTLSSFTFVNNSVMLLKTTTNNLLSLDLDEPTRGWQFLDENGRYGGILYGEDPCFLIGGDDDQLRVSPLGISHVSDMVRFFRLPRPSYGVPYVHETSSHITLLDHDTNGECKFCRVNIGFYDYSSYMSVDVFAFDYGKYIKDKKDGEGKKRCARLSTRILKSSKFEIASSPRTVFFGHEMFPLQTAAINRYVINESVYFESLAF